MRGVGLCGRGKRLFWCRWCGLLGLDGDDGRLLREGEVELEGLREEVVDLEVVWVLVVGEGGHPVHARILCLRAQ